jgi:hypothetical protein
MSTGELSAEAWLARGIEAYQVKRFEEAERAFRERHCHGLRLRPGTPGTWCGPFDPL